MAKTSNKNKPFKSYKSDVVKKALFESLSKGATVIAACKAARITPDTFYHWKKVDKHFQQLLSEVERARVQTVIGAMYQHAVGYECKEDKIFLHKGKPVVVPTIKRYAPDTAAGIFLGVNWDPDNYQSVNKVEVTGKGGGPLKILFGIPPTDPAPVDKKEESESKEA